MLHQRPDCLHRRRGHGVEQLGEMRTAVGASDFLANFLTPAAAHLYTNTGLVVGRNAGAHLERAMLRGSLYVDNGKAAVYRHSQQHFMERLTHRHLASPVVAELVGLGIGHMRFYIPQPVFALVAAIIYCAGMDVSAGSGVGEGH